MCWPTWIGEKATMRRAMWDMNEVTKVEYRGEYTYRVSFDDGVEGEIDFSDYLSRGPIFEPLKDKALFSKARVEGGTIGWPNGADVAPETLYEKLRHADQSRRHSAEKEGYAPTQSLD